MEKYKLVVCGGTFDLLHRGHKDFLKYIFGLGEKVVIGLTSDAYIQNFKKDTLISDYKQREKALLDYISSIGEKENTQIIPIDDHFGPAIDPAFAFDCLIATHATSQNADLVNGKRSVMGLKVLPIEVFDLTSAEDGGFITSTRIRNGEIDREGNLLVDKSWLDNNLRLPDDVRQILKKPLGEIVSLETIQIDPSRTVAVGDATVQNFVHRNITNQISIIDLKIERENKFQNTEDVGLKNVAEIKIDNPAGTVSQQVWRVLPDMFKNTQKSALIVNGEEDLMVLPALICAPLGWSIFYGQPHEGLVQITVSEENKRETKELLQKFLR